MKKKTINPPTLFNSKQFGFSQVVISDPGKMVFISGQVAWDENLDISGINDLAGQTRKSLNNLEIAIREAGGNLSDIVMLRIYIVNYRPENGSVISALLREKFGTESPPASTWISVQGLANADFLIEIEAQGIIS